MAFLLPHEMISAEYANSTWTVKVPAGVTVERLQDPIYWTNVANVMRQWDRVQCQYLHNDGMWLAQFIVTGVDEEKRNWAKLKLVAYNELIRGQAAALPETPVEDTDFLVKWRGPHGKWSVIRKVDSAIVFDKGTHPDDANRWIKDYRAKVAA